MFKAHHLSQPMRLWYLSHRRQVKAQASLRIRALSPEPSLFAHIKYGRRQRVRPKIRHLAPLDGCAFRLKNEFTEDEKYHNLMTWLTYGMTSEEKADFEAIKHTSDIMKKYLIQFYGVGLLGIIDIGCSLLKHYLRELYFRYYSVFNGWWIQHSRETFGFRKTFGHINLT